MATLNTEPIINEKKDFINTILQRRKDSEADLSEFFSNMFESFEFYKSKQYDAKVVAALKAKGLPYHVINICKETVNTMSGWQRQNKTEPVVLPIEGTDERVAEIMGRTIKWDFERGLNGEVQQIAFKDKVIGGLGINFVYVDFTDDLENGDVKISHVSPFDVRFDPLMKNLDLSDCRYIIYEGRFEKDELIGRFPEYKEQIKSLEPSDNKKTISGETKPVNKKDRGLLVTEYWYREFYKQKYYTDIETGSIVEFNGDSDELQAIKETKNIEDFDRTLSKIKLAILIEDKILVYDGENPYKIKKYPWAFNFGYYEPSIDDWSIKLTGEVDRSLKDIQKEKNKIRSQMTAIVAKMPNTGFFVEEGSLDDENKLEKSGGAAKIIHYRRGRQAPMPIQPLQLPPALIQLAQMTEPDQYKAGLKAELLGAMGEKGAPLGLHQMRQQQSLMAVQEQFDHHGIFIKQIGNIMIDLILEHYSKDKIKRIVGADLSFEQEKKELKKRIIELERFVPTTQEESAAFNKQVQDIKIEMAQLEAEEAEFWQAWDDLKENAKFDIQIDDTTNSTTYKLATEMMLLQFAQAGGGVDPDILIEASSLPKSVKEKLLDRYYQNQQQQQQMAQMQLQMKMQSEMQKNETERMKALAGMSGKVDIDRSKDIQ